MIHTNGGNNMYATSADWSFASLPDDFQSSSNDFPAEIKGNIPEYLVKITKFSTSVRQAVEYSKIIYDMFVRRELIKISEQTIDSAKINDLDTLHYQKFLNQILLQKP